MTGEGNKSRLEGGENLKGQREIEGQRKAEKGERSSDIVKRVVKRDGHKEEPAALSFRHDISTFFKNTETKSLPYILEPKENREIKITKKKGKYEEKTKMTKDRDLFFFRKMEDFMELLPKKGEILELGSGLGRFSYHILQKLEETNKDVNITGIDLKSPKRIYFNKDTETQGIKNNFETIQGKVENLKELLKSNNTPSKKFDLIYSQFAAQYSKNPIEWLKISDELLEKNGKGLIHIGLLNQYDQELLKDIIQHNPHIQFELYPIEVMRYDITSKKPTKKKRECLIVAEWEKSDRPIISPPIQAEQRIPKNQEMIPHQFNMYAYKSSTQLT